VLTINGKNRRKGWAMAFPVVMLIAKFEPHFRQDVDWSGKPRSG
jgi:hypothetical protein